MIQRYGDSIYSLTFNAVSVSVAQDLFELVAPSDSRALVHEIQIGQYSDAGDAEDELLSILLIRGNTTSGSGGASVTPGLFNPYLRASAAAAERNNTTVASGGSPVTLVADSFNVRAGWYWNAGSEKCAIMLQPAQRFVVRVTAPADAITMNGTLVFEEIGKAPVS